MAIFSSEAVTPGHPDKLCDRISDAILDACLEQDPKSRVACEVMATRDTLLIGGEITTSADVDLENVARKVIENTGYKDKWEYSPEVLTRVSRQSPDIAMGTNASLGLDQGAGDQGLMFGYATNAPDALHPAHSLAVKLARALYDLHLRFPDLYGPDGKTQVSMNDDGEVTTIVASLLHSPEIPPNDIETAILRAFQGVSHLSPTSKVLINPSGRFTIGGPAADTGLTGRKIIADTYGGAARHGGGAFSGKDASKVDRSAAYLARSIARDLVANDVMNTCEIQLAYAIGKPEPVSFSVSGDGDIQAATERYKDFDFRPAATIERFGLTKPIFEKTAMFGHFVDNFPWESELEGL